MAEGEDGRLLLQQESPLPKLSNYMGLSEATEKMMSSYSYSYHPQEAGVNFENTSLCDFK